MENNKRAGKKAQPLRWNQNQIQRQRSTHPHPHRGYLSQLLPVPCFLPRISSLHPPSLSVAIAPSLSRHRSSFSVVLCRRWSSSFGLATVALNACGWTWTCRIRIDIIKTGLLPPTFHVLRLRPSPRIFPPPLFIDQLRYGLLYLPTWIWFLFAVVSRILHTCWPTGKGARQKDKKGRASGSLTMVAWHPNDPIMTVDRRTHRKCQIWAC